MLQIKSSGFPKRPLRRKFWSPLSQRKISIHPSRVRFYTLKVQKLLLSPPRTQGETKGNNSVERNIKENWQDLLSKGNPPSKREKRNAFGRNAFPPPLEVHGVTVQIYFLPSVIKVLFRALGAALALKQGSAQTHKYPCGAAVSVATLLGVHSISRIQLFQTEFIYILVSTLHTYNFSKSPSCTLNILETFLLVVAPFKLIGLPSKWNISKLFCYSPRKFPFRHNHLSFLNST